MRLSVILLVAWTTPGRRITGPGTIPLQAHDAKSAVLYKNIRLRPLD
jgi:hypothetical protein